MPSSTGAMAEGTTSKRKDRDSNSGSSTAKSAGTASRREDTTIRTSTTTNSNGGPVRVISSRLVNGNGSRVSRENAKPTLSSMRGSNNVISSRSSFNSRVYGPSARKSRATITPTSYLARNSNGSHGPTKRHQDCPVPTSAATKRQGTMPATVGSSVNSAITSTATTRERRPTASICCKRRSEDQSNNNSQQSTTNTPVGTYNGLPHSLKTTPQTDYDSPPTQTTIGNESIESLPSRVQSTTRRPAGRTQTLEDQGVPNTSEGDDEVEGEEVDDGTNEPGDDLLGEEEPAEAAEAAEPAEDAEDPVDEEPMVGEENGEEGSAGRRKGPLEYDLKLMYPEMELLTKAPRRDWDYNDPEVIRAIWLETKTHALADWKQKHVKIKHDSDKKVEVQENNAARLRNEFRKMKQEKAHEEEAALIIGRDAPHYQELTLPTTMTAQLRYKLHRDEPPIPEWFIFHYAKYKKPPFIKNTFPHDVCRKPDAGN